MKSLESLTRRASCIVLLTGLVSATLVAESATARACVGRGCAVNKEGLPPPLSINPYGPSVAPANPPPAASFNPYGAWTAPPPQNIPPPGSYNPYGNIPQANPYNPNGAVLTQQIPAGTCATAVGICPIYQTAGTPCQCTDGVYLYPGIVTLVR
jgi:hypothetical protein